MTDCFDNGNNPADFHEKLEFLDQLTDFRHFKKCHAEWSLLFLEM
jgi:hypothetical protein